MINGISPWLLTPPAAEGKATDGAADDKRLREVAREFEAVFLEIILRQMRSATRAISGEKVGMDRDTYEGWQDQELAKSMSADNGIGLGERLYRQLQQEQLRRETTDKSGAPE